MSHTEIDVIEQIRNDLLCYLTDKINYDIANRIVNETIHLINYRLTFCLNQIKYLHTTTPLSTSKNHIFF